MRRLKVVDCVRRVCTKNQLNLLLKTAMKATSLFYPIVSDTRSLRALTFWIVT